MDLLQFDLNLYSFNAAALAIIGLASTVYLLRLKDKTPATTFVIIGLAGFTVGMVSMFAGRIVLWGGALDPATDACAIVSMAAMIGFCYHYPQRVRTPEARLVQTFAVVASLIALGVCLRHAFPILILHRFQSSIPAAFWFLNPLTFIVALAVCVRRTVVVQRDRFPAVSPVGRMVWLAFCRPQGHQARLLRNFSLALSLGLIQGFASSLGLIGLFPALPGAILINLSLLLMMIAIVYASFDLTAQQPNLTVRLVGLSLVTLLEIWGVFGMYDVNMAARWIGERNIADVETVRQTIRAGHLAALPEAVVYVLAWPDRPTGSTSDPAAGQLAYARPDFDPQWVRLPSFSSAAVPIWQYFALGWNSDLRATPVQWRYGNHPIGSYHRYASYVFVEDEIQYEVGFSLAEMSRVTQAQSRSILWALIGSSLFILIVFPVFFRANLIKPLERLLTGVRKVDAGDLSVMVPVTYADEVGFLTAVFNKMTASLREELEQRQRVEAELRRLNITLEQRVADRTRELEALYDVSAAAGQARDTSTLLAVLLEHTQAALRSTTGFILLFDETAGDVPCLQLVAGQGIPPDWLPHMETWLDNCDWALTVLAQREAVLIPDVTCDPRVPAFMSQVAPLTLILAPLQAEGQVLGILGLARQVEHPFDLDEVALLTSTVGQVGGAVYTDHLRQRAQQATVLEERERLARDLHDSVTQSLYGLVTLTEAGQMQAEARDVSAVARILTRIGQTARQAIREMRLFIYQLRPSVLEQEGLVNALDLRLAAVEGRSDVQACLQADESIRLPLPVETALYHIAQEALNNALKHAQASVVTIHLTRTPQGIVLEVADDGRGFDPGRVNSSGMGLGNMRARAAAIGARLDIDSQPGRGTRIRVLVSEHL